MLLVVEMSAQTTFQNPLVINTLDGLLSDRITALAQDSDGFVWIGTSKGLCRSDGLSVICFPHDPEDDRTILSNTIRAILPDSINKRIWIATYAGLSAFDISSQSIINYPYQRNDPHSPPAGQALTLLQDRQGTVWAGFRLGGLLRYRPETDDFVHLPCRANRLGEAGAVCHETIRHIIEDPDDEDLLWLAVQSGLLRFNKRTLEYGYFYWEHTDKKKEKYLNTANGIFAPGDGNIYLGTWYEGVVVFNQKSQTFRLLDPCFEGGMEQFPFVVIWDFYPHSETEFWINSEQGLQLYDQQTNCITASYANNPDEDIWYSIDYVDDQGRIWSGTRTDGLRIYNPLLQQYEQLIFARDDNGFTNQTMAIVEDTVRKRLYVGSVSTEGLHYLDQRTEQWSTVPFPPDLDPESEGNTSILGMELMTDGRLLLTQHNDLYVYEPGAKFLKRYPVSLPAGRRRMKKIIKGKLGEYWISSWDAGFFRLNENTGTLDNFVDELSRFDNELRWGGDYMVEDRNHNIWMRENNGLLVYEAAKDTFTYLAHDASRNQLLRGLTKMSAGPDGSVWIADYNRGVAKVHADSIEYGVLRRYGKADGLSGNSVYLVTQFEDKPLAFTEKGMELLDPVSGKYRKIFDAQYGIRDISVCKWLADGRLALGKRKEIIIIDLDRLMINEEVAIPYVSAFSIFDEPQALTYGTGHVDSIYLNPGQNFFSFEISGLGYNLPGQTRFRYMLEGFDLDWKDGTKRRFASYTNVPGGTYRFLIQTINSEGIPSSEYSITWLYISTAWYKTNWFWGLMSMLLLGMGWSIYRYRVGQIRKEERLKTSYEKKLAQVEMSALRAQMNPHFIFNSLNSIEYYIIENDPERASDYLNRFSRLIRLILQNSKSATVPLGDELEALKLYVEMENLRFDGLFDYELKVEAELNTQAVHLPPMLMQPYVENAIWHGLMQKQGGGGQLCISVRREGKDLLCCIEDNGIGREAARRIKSKSATKRKSYGMKITSDRLHMMSQLSSAQATVVVADLVNENYEAKGTRVELRIPLKYANSLTEIH